MYISGNRKVIPMDRLRQIARTSKWPLSPYRVSSDNMLPDSEKAWPLVMIIVRFVAKKIVLGYSRYLQMIEYITMNFDGLVKSPKKANFQISHSIISIAYEVQIKEF